jgi:sarcosine oxidase
MTSKYEVIVLGLGGMGSAIANDLVHKGISVLGLEQFSPVHDQGSSHGETRAIRKAYFEDLKYVPLILRSYELWGRLEARAGEKFLERCGCLIIGPKESRVIEGCLHAAKAANLEYTLQPADELNLKYGFSASSGSIGFFEPDGGYVFPEKSVDFLIRDSMRQGADLKFNQKIESWKSTEHAVQIEANGQTYHAKKLIVCLGAWTGKMFPSLRLPLSPKRTVMFWFNGEKVRAELPVFFQETTGPWIYGFPNINGKMKVAFHNVFQDCDPDNVKRTVDVAEADQIQNYAKALIPNLGEYAAAKTCMYTMTPDEHFILGSLEKSHPNIFMACGFSGHGFKFAPVVAEIAADFVLGKKRHDIAFLSPYRF